MKYIISCKQENEPDNYYVELETTEDLDKASEIIESYKASDKIDKYYNPDKPNVIYKVIDENGIIEYYE